MSTALIMAIFSLTAPSLRHHDPLLEEEDHLGMVTDEEDVLHVGQLLAVQTGHGAGVLVSDVEVTVG